MRFAEMMQDVLITKPTLLLTPTLLLLKLGRGSIYQEGMKVLKNKEVHTFDDETVCINLIEFLTNKMTLRNSFVQDLVQSQEDFRKNLMILDKENIQLKQEKSTLQMDLDAYEQQIRCLERKLSASDQIVEMLQKQLSDAKNEVEAAKFQMSTKDNILSEQENEVQCVKLKMQEKLALGKDRMRRIMEKRLAAKQAELERKMCITNEKFRRLREILNADDWEYYGDIWDFVPGVGKQSASTFQVDTDYLSRKGNKLPVTFQRSVAIANRRHRRSQSSSDDVWIEHKPAGNLELNTVLQPAVRKKKSVSKLKLKHFTTSASKYVLEHQDQNSEGEVEIYLYKADVIPSAGGGIQVIFNDIEILQMSHQQII